MRTARTREPRGGATVETAVMMIALVPLIMYTFYLSDLVFYHLDQDEAVYSSAWDFLSFDYRHLQAGASKGASSPKNNPEPTGATTVDWVSHSNRRTYADHSSAFNTYGDPAKDANDTDHHQALAAHECWFANANGGDQNNMGEQVTCRREFGGLGGGGITDYGSPAGEYSLTLAKDTGGIYNCRARIGVENYFLPTVFLNFGKKNKAGNVGLTPDLDSGEMKRYVAPTGSGTQRGDTITKNAEGDAFMFPVGSFAVMHDSWALNWVRDDNILSGKYPRDRSSAHVDIDPAKHPLNLTLNFDEISRWTMVPMGMVAAYLNPVSSAPYTFLSDMVNNNMSTSALGKLEPAGVLGGDILETPPIAWNKKRDFAIQGQYGSGWKDSRQAGMIGSGVATDYLRLAESDW
jgi:hypothetical protein